MNTKKTSWIFISVIAILNILLFLSDVITIVEFNIATSLIIIVSSIICIIECKERKKIRIEKEKTNETVQRSHF